MTRRVRGEQQLPGATEKLLQATKPQRPRVAEPLREYLALSVSVAADGTWTVRCLTLDSGSGNVVPTLLDRGDTVLGGRQTLLAMLRYWAGEAALAEDREYL